MYPAQSVLAGDGPRDAWWMVSPIGRPERVLIETGGGFLIRRLQEVLQNELQTNAANLPSFGMSDTNRWDANVARATLLLTDKSGILKDIYSETAFIDSAWGDYYARRWGKPLATLALAIISNRAFTDVISQAILGVADAGGANPFTNLSGNFVVELSRDCLLPRWDYAPGGVNPNATTEDSVFARLL